MKPQYVLLQKEIDPSLTILFKEGNQYHPEIISNGEFSIVIENWNEGTYSFVNTQESPGKISNAHFKPKNAKPLKTMYDLNKLWTVVTGDPLTYVGKELEKIEIGRTYQSKRGGSFKVVEKLEGNKSKVMFDDGYITTAQNVNIFRGYVRNPYLPSLFGEGYIGEGKYSSSDKEVYTPWKSMMQRCYDENSRHLYKSYKGVEVCKEWKCLQNFGAWFEENYNPETMQGWAIDKDILAEDKKIYSPETCAFVPPSINNVLVKAVGKNNGQPTGVEKRGNSYYVRFFKGNEHFRSIRYDSSKEASFVYGYEKDKYIKELAERFKDVLDPRIYDKLVDYKTKIFIGDEE